MPVTREQMQAAVWLTSEAKAYAPLIALIPEIQPGLLAQLREAHNAVGFNCSAASEGMVCCVDILLSDPSGYSPANVAAAEELVEHWRQENGIGRTP